MSHRKKKQPANVEQPDQRERFRAVIGGTLHADLKGVESQINTINARLKMIDADLQNFDKDERVTAASAFRQIETATRWINELQSVLNTPDLGSTPF